MLARNRHLWPANGNRAQVSTSGRRQAGASCRSSGARGAILSGQGCMALFLPQPGGGPAWTPGPIPSGGPLGPRLLDAARGSGAARNPPPAHR